MANLECRVALDAVLLAKFRILCAVNLLLVNSLELCLCEFDILPLAALETCSYFRFQFCRGFLILWRQSLAVPTLQSVAIKPTHPRSEEFSKNEAILFQSLIEIRRRQFEHITRGADRRDERERRSQNSK
jgi:hypothetical protein